LVQFQEWPSQCFREKEKEKEKLDLYDLNIWPLYGIKGTLFQSYLFPPQIHNLEWLSRPFFYHELKDKIRTLTYFSFNSFLSSLLKGNIAFTLKKLRIFLIQPGQSLSLPRTSHNFVLDWCLLPSFIHSVNVFPTLTSPSYTIFHTTRICKEDKVPVLKTFMFY
jgi:hypothetical protein